MLESHVGSWEAAFVLLLIGYVLYRLGKERAARIMQMVLRLLYLIIVGSGIWMLVQYHKTEPLYYVKGILGIVTISLAEMAMVRAAKQRPSLGFLIGAVVLFVLVILIGYRVIL
ncbi:MAG: YisL family protein [Brevibacillus sp.]|nr:YisL family protein [Brevibacillus sp.]